MRRGAISVRVLVIALVVQLLLGGALIWGALTGFRFFVSEHSTHAHSSVPKRR
jgi:hypothetical protein